MPTHTENRDFIRCAFRDAFSRAFPGYASIAWSVPRSVGVSLARFPSRPGDVFDTLDALCDVFGAALDRSVDCWHASQEPASRTFTGSTGYANRYGAIDADTGEDLGWFVLYVDGESAETVFAIECEIDPRVIR